jgi:hypothetical protein
MKRRLFQRPPVEESSSAVSMCHPPGEQHLRESHSTPARCPRCAHDRARGTGTMTRLCIASLSVAVVAGDHAGLELIDGQLVSHRSSLPQSDSLIDKARAYAGQLRRPSTADNGVLT